MNIKILKICNISARCSFITPLIIMIKTLSVDIVVCCIAFFLLNFLLYYNYMHMVFNLKNVMQLKCIWFDADANVIKVVL